MDYIIRKILDWSEVWALLIPLAILLWNNPKATWLKPIKLFIFISIIINLGIDLIAEFKKKWGLTPDDFLWNNNFLYNASSVVRLILFSWFFILLHQRFMHRVKWIIPFAFLVFVIINFSFFENFIPQGDYEAFSSRLLATEAALLLFYCLQYFIYLIIEDKHSHLKTAAGFWIVTGLSIYVGANFFIYLFYEYLSVKTMNFAVTIWDVHNIVFIIFCIFISIQFYMENKKQAA